MDRGELASPFLGPASQAITISRSVRVDAADLHVDLLLIVNCKTAERYLNSLKYQSAYPHTLLFFTGTVASSRTFLQLANNGIMVMAARPHEL